METKSSEFLQSRMMKILLVGKQRGNGAAGARGIRAPVQQLYSGCGRCSISVEK